LFCIDHDLANVSSVWAVRISSQSFERAAEYDIAEIGGNLREVTGIERFVAFFARDPGDVDIESQLMKIQEMIKIHLEITQRNENRAPQRCTEDYDLSTR